MGAARKGRRREWLPCRFHRASAQGSGAEKELNILSSFCRGDGLGTHRQKSAKKQNCRAPKLSVSESFAIDPSGKTHCDGWAKELETLRERDSDFPDSHVIQDVGKGNTSDC